MLVEVPDVPSVGLPGASTEVHYRNGPTVDLGRPSVVDVRETDDSAYVSVPLINRGVGLALIRDVKLRRTGTGGQSLGGAEGGAPEITVPVNAVVRLRFSLAKDDEGAPAISELLEGGLFSVTTTYSDLNLNFWATRADIYRDPDLGHWRIGGIFIWRIHDLHSGWLQSFGASRF